MSSGKEYKIAEDCRLFPPPLLNTRPLLHISALAHPIEKSSSAVKSCSLIARGQVPMYSIGI